MMKVLVLFGVSLVALLAASRKGPPPRAEQLALVWTPTYFRREAAALQGTPWYADYRWLSAVLLTLTFSLVLAFA